MLLEGAGEHAGPIPASNKVEVVHVFGIKGTVQRILARTANRGGRQSTSGVGVVRSRGAQVFAGEVAVAPCNSVNHGRVACQQHALAQAVVEAGGHEKLSRGKHWVSGLLTNLRKPDPSSSRAIYVLTLTRLFMLTWPFPSLVREITTPNLPHLIKTCLNNISSNTTNDKDRRTILECFLKLIPHHPTVFRAHASDLQQITGTILGLSEESKPSPELATIPEASRLVAIQLRTALHGCAPKQGSTASWEEGINSQISTCHKLADTVFASVATDSGSNASQRVKPTEYSSAVDQLELSMNIVASYILSESPAPVTLPVKTLHELGSRILTVVVSASYRRSGFAVELVRGRSFFCPLGASCLVVP